MTHILDSQVNVRSHQHRNKIQHELGSIYGVKYLPLCLDTLTLRTVYI